jgi:nicotinamidase-related amidase
MQEPRLLNPGDAVVAMVDIQANHYPTVIRGDETLDRMVRLVRASRTLEVPVVWTEHYPRAFGATLPPLAAALEGLEPIPKTSFGCFGEPRFEAAVAATGRRSLVLVGSETHICIAQTALMALERGMDVVVLADCVTARGELDHDIALRRLERAGAVITTWEALVYEWMRKAGHPAFKQILSIVKGG